MSDVGFGAEASLFWRVASEARRIRREDTANPTAAQQEDLEGIVINSEWGRLQDRARSAIDELQGRLPIVAEEAACESSA